MTATMASRSRTPLAFSLALCALLLGTSVSGSIAERVTLDDRFDPAIFRVEDASVPLIIQRDAGGGGVARAVRGLGGTITRDLPIVDGFSARVPAASLRRLARVQGIRAISLDRAVRLLHAGPDPVNAANTATVGAPQVWNAGYDGRGVTVAVIDTGIASVPDLAGRIVPVTVNAVTGETAPCMNFSGEAGCADSYGHGTFVAGVIAGNGTKSGGTWKGVAPRAKVLSVKLAGRDGGADVSTLLAAIQWVVSYKDAYGIRVLNLSVGSDSPQSYLIDPLNYAVERAWSAGIVVVAAAGNRGPGPATVIKPADDPWVVTVGAVDDGGTADPGDDIVPDFSGRGPTLSDSFAKPDLVAPGAHIISLRAPGSAIDENFPQAFDPWYRRGSGTSFAAPAVAGTVALMLQRDPTLGPDRVKYALTAAARPTASANPFEVGAGMLDAYASVMAPAAGQANQGLTQSDGSGSIEASRGTLRFTSDLGTPIEGAITQQLTVFDGVAYRTLEWTGASWHASQWTGASWHGASWHGASWHGASWHGASWHGASWHGTNGEEPSYGVPYLGSALYGAWE